MNDINPKDAFQHLYGALTEYQTRFISTTLQGLTAITVVIGWLVSQEKAREYLTHHSGWSLAGSVVVLVSAVSYNLLSLRIMGVLRQLDSQLRALAYFPPAYYEFRRMNMFLAVALMAFVDLPCLMVVGYLVCAGGVR